MRSRFGVVAMVSGGGGGGRPREREIRTGGFQQPHPVTHTDTSRFSFVRRLTRSSSPRRRLTRSSSPSPSTHSIYHQSSVITHSFVRHRSRLQLAGLFLFNLKIKDCQLCVSVLCTGVASITIESDSMVSIAWVNGSDGVGNVDLNGSADFLANQGALSRLDQVVWA
ncbi:hypothetical protein LWI29_008248 [Acer saccharum]|uniref:Uncharacterized protein n=1 Tax=Acer saccharum TaxID=4024 RepID=A0AA39RKK0_ACESA|nr:hypothetical protein LWI29_008248 [Acer saccharum]